MGKIDVYDGTTAAIVWKNGDVSFKEETTEVKRNGVAITRSNLLYFHLSADELSLLKNSFSKKGWLMLDYHPYQLPSDSPTIIKIEQVLSESKSHPDLLHVYTYYFGQIKNEPLSLEIGISPSRRSQINSYRTTIGTVALPILIVPAFVIDVVTFPILLFSLKLPDG